MPCGSGDVSISRSAIALARFVFLLPLIVLESVPVVTDGVIRSAEIVLALASAVRTCAGIGNGALSEGRKRGDCVSQAMQNWEEEKKRFSFFLRYFRVAPS